MRTPRMRNNFWLMEDEFREIVESIIEKRYGEVYGWELIPLWDNEFEIDVLFSDKDDDCESIMYSEIVYSTSEYFGREVMAIVRLFDHNENEFIIDLGYAEV